MSHKSRRGRGHQKVIREVTKEVSKENSIAILLGILTARYGVSTEEIEARLESIDNHSRLRELATQAATCFDL